MTATLDRSNQPGPGLDARMGSLFLRAQARWLTHALRHTGSRQIVGTVLVLHDASHPGWLRLIAEMQRADASVAAALVTVYAFHGRAAGSLERGHDDSLGTDVREQVLDLLARRLNQLTDDAVAMIEVVAAR